jgi:hypothetical protein
MKTTHVFWLIALGVAGWGIFHAIGSYLGGVNAEGGPALQPDVRRALMIAACVAAFLAFWGVMLYARKRRVERESRGE